MTVQAITAGFSATVIAFLLAITSSTASPAAGHSCMKDRTAMIAAASAISVAVSGSTLAIRRMRSSVSWPSLSAIGKSSPARRG